MGCPRDLGQVELWQESLERSLARRRRSKRSSVDLLRLLGERDLLLEDAVLESEQYSRLRRRAAAERSLIPRPAAAVSRVSALTLAVTTLAVLFGGRGATNQRITYAANVGARGRAAKGSASASLQLRSSHRALVGDFTPVAFRRAAPNVVPVSEGVRQLQRRLGVVADGEFGPITLSAVEDFQASHGLVVDGIVGPATRAALGLPPGPLLRANPIYFPKLVTGESIRQLQRRLGVVADGEFGPITLSAVKGFQASHGLAMDGIVGPATRAALGLPPGPLLRANPIYFPGRPAVASWYNDAGSTACGYHAYFGVANKSLPCGTPVTVRYGGRSVTAVVDDRGPYVSGREFDLNQNTAAALGFSGVGVGVVWVSY